MKSLNLGFEAHQMPVLKVCRCVEIQAFQQLSDMRAGAMIAACFSEVAGRFWGFAGLIFCANSQGTAIPDPHNPRGSFETQIAIEAFRRVVEA